MSSHRIEIIKELRALEQFCTFKAVRTGEESERFLRDYLADIEELPLEAIKKACAKWRQSGQTKFPVPGQLIPLIRGCMAAEPKARAEAWRPLDNAEYDALSLPEKIRHHRILSHEARLKAGPMWCNGGPTTAEQMPDIWRSWNARAENHEAEVGRLKGFLRRSTAMAAE